MTICSRCHGTLGVYAREGEGSTDGRGEDPHAAQARRGAFLAISRV
jgi:hypothetical protein